VDRRFGAVVVYWFSSSGNTLVVANEIAAALRSRGSEVDLRPLDRSDPRRVDLGKALGIVVPVAGQGTYPFVWDFLEALPESRGTPCFLADTLGLYSGGIVGPVRRILRRKRYDPVAAKEILMPNIFLRKRPDPERAEALIARGREEARRFAGDLLDGTGRWRDMPLYSDFMSVFYRRRSTVKVWRKLFPWSVNAPACRRCGLCARLCPERSISLDAATGLPANIGSCVLCERCFSFCPTGAIGIGGPGTIVSRAVSTGEMLESLGERSAPGQY
jgi:ferredoxin/flavodoxin